MSIYITVPDYIELLFHLFLARKQLVLCLPWVLVLLVSKSVMLSAMLIIQWVLMLKNKSSQQVWPFLYPLQ